MGGTEVWLLVPKQSQRERSARIDALMRRAVAEKRRQEGGE